MRSSLIEVLQYLVSVFLLIVIDRDKTFIYVVLLLIHMILRDCDFFEKVSFSFKVIIMQCILCNAGGMDEGM